MSLWSQVTTQQSQASDISLTPGQAGGSGGGGAVSYTIQGVPVQFPTKAYPSQIAMMNNIIQALKQNKNCLLESPTGSGKTLALLCAALAWRNYECDRVQKFNAEIDARAIQATANKQNQQVKTKKTEEPPVITLSPDRVEKFNEEINARAIEATADKQNQQAKKTKTEEPPVVTLSSETKPSVSSNNGGCCGPVDGCLSDSGFSSCNSKRSSTFEETEDEDEDFKPPKRLKSFGLEVFAAPTPPVLGRPSGGSVTPRPKTAAADNTAVSVKDEPYFVPAEKRLTVPKIFFGTRTHKQLSQITRELRKTAYKDTRTVVLASRDHTCIHPLVQGLSNKNERCKDLLDSSSEGGTGCIYFSQARKFGNYGVLQGYGVGTVYDIEDIVKAGKTAKACPYYATRYLMQTADLIFCPYNYIVDPSIRESMNMELDGQVVILDEAHNMEDASREAASFIIKQHDVNKAMQECERVQNGGGAEPHALGEIASMLTMFSTWLDAQTQGLKDTSYNTSSRHWTGTDLIASLIAYGITLNRVGNMEACFKAVMVQREIDMERTKEMGIKYGSEKPAITSATIMTIESFIRLFFEMRRNNGQNRDDFRIALMKTIERRSASRGMYQHLPTLSLNIWCLNPAVAFSQIRDLMRSIVLTSGTLSPMKSFQSELGTPFPLKLEASHVIDKNQVWAGVLGAGPSGKNLNGAYQNTETFAYQDELGSVVKYVCNTMPFGVLCFFPSYRLLETMYNRWRQTSLLDELEAKKLVVIEPRGGGDDFKTAMDQYYAAIAIATNEQENVEGQTGALFLAVCRGKVSEGLDFSDNNARAVICIGIPFPNYRDTQVELKREYNQSNMKRGLLSGSEWYEIQAFRALNQALGRCIRHRHDWGAILLVDDRYIQTPRYIQSLSKWIRSSVQFFKKFDEHFQDSLESFRDEMLARPVPDETVFDSQALSSIDSIDANRSIFSPGFALNRDSDSSRSDSNNDVDNDNFEPFMRGRKVNKPSNALIKFPEPESNSTLAEERIATAKTPASSKTSDNKSGGGVKAMFARQLLKK